VQGEILRDGASSTKPYESVSRKISTPQSRCAAAQNKKKQPFGCFKLGTWRTNQALGATNRADETLKRWSVLPRRERRGHRENLSITKHY